MAYGLAELISFFTSGEDECRAWTIRSGTNAQDAAGAIHSDLARGFIRAEVIRWDQLLEAGSEAAAKKRGWVRQEGKVVHRPGRRRPARPVQRLSAQRSRASLHQAARLRAGRQQARRKASGR